LTDFISEFGKASGSKFATDNLVKIAEKDVESYITGRRATYEYARVQRRLIHHFKEVAKYHLAGGACDPIHEVEGV